MQDQLEEQDLVELLKPYENKWVALSMDHAKVLGAGDTLKEAEEQAKKAGEKYVFLKLPPYDASFISSPL